jgi:outer membrane protein
VISRHFECRRALAPSFAVLLLTAACAGSADRALRSERVEPGTSPSPAVPWSAPQSAIPPAVAAPANPIDAYKPGMPMSLPQLLEIALANNPSTRSAWLQARTAEAELGASRSALLPEVDFNGSLGRNRQIASSTTTAQTSLAPSLALSYLLFDFGGRAAAIEQSKQTLIAADFTHNAVIQNVILRVEQSYYDVLDLQALLEAQQATVKELQANVDAADARHSAGVATIADVLQARTAFSQARLTLDTLEGSLRSAEGGLATSLGLRVTAQFELGALPDNIPTEQVATTIDQLLDAAQRERPDLASTRALAIRAEARVRQVRSAYLPSVSIAATGGRTFGIGARSSSGPQYSAGLALRFPLFTGFRNVYDVRAAELEARLAGEDVRGLEQQIGLEVWTSYFGVSTAAQRVRSSRDLLASAQQSFDVARGRYREGVGNILDLLTAQAALENGRAQEVQARADWLLSLAQLSHDLGALTPATAVANRGAGVSPK